jgi:hypothetical protein
LSEAGESANNASGEMPRAASICVIYNTSQPLYITELHTCDGASWHTVRNMVHASHIRAPATNIQRSRKRVYYIYSPRSASTSTSENWFIVKEAASHFISVPAHAPHGHKQSQGNREQQATPPVFMHTHASAYAHGP